MALIQKIARVGEKYVVDTSTSIPVGTIQAIVNTIPFTRESTVKLTNEGTFENFTAKVISNTQTTWNYTMLINIFKGVGDFHTASLYQTLIKRTPSGITTSYLVHG